ncbi:MAG: hypothetical protein WBZ19_25450 [Chthoniobacterales bacterium]
MLKNVDLSREVAKAEYKRLKSDLDLKLADLQRQVKAQGIPVIIVFEGWSASGKGTLINQLILPLDPRGFTVYSASGPTEEEKFYPFLWRFWKRTPTRGRLAIFDRSWNRRVVTDRVEGQIKGKQLRQALEDIRSFERQLTDDGVVMVKFFLHISKHEQKQRFDALKESAATAWRVTEADLRQNKHYDEYLAAAENMLTETDTEYAPWTVVEAHDRRFATLKAFTTMIDALERGVAVAGRKGDEAPAPAVQPAPTINAFKTTALDHVDLSLSLTAEEYTDRLKEAQNRLRELEHQIYRRRMPVVIAYEGWDAAGKGGNIRRLTQNLDPRGYEVIPIAAPNDIEKAHHYLWRFWAQLPKAGHIAIFDRRGTAGCWSNGLKGSALRPNGDGRIERLTRWNNSWCISERSCSSSGCKSIPTNSYDGLRSERKMSISSGRSRKRTGEIDQNWISTEMQLRRCCIGPVRRTHRGRSWNRTANGMLG